MEDNGPFVINFNNVDDSGWGDDSDSDDDSSIQLVNHSANIARGIANISSPEEEVIKSRGRVNNKRTRSDEPSSESSSSRDSVLLHLVTRKSPRKPLVKSVNDFANDYFRSPTPKKARGTPKKSGNKVTPIKSSSDYKVNPKKAAFRKRLTLNSSDSGTGSDSTPSTVGRGSNSPSPRIFNEPSPTTSSVNSSSSVTSHS